MRLLTALTLLLAGCPEPPAATGTCRDAGECEGIAVCTEAGECLDVECTHNTHCNLGYRCDDTNTCVQGCETEDDCLAGETCTGAGQCEPYGCRSTNLDCGYGERCDPATHQCVDDTLPHCQPDCVVDFYSDSCQAVTPNAVCACFGSFSGSTCVGNTYCLVQCNPSVAEPCPRGFQCAQAFASDPTPYCIADCDFISQF